MAQVTETDSKVLIERINVRLRVWRRSWVICLILYFGLGTTSVALSALAATDLVNEQPRKMCSVIAAACVALLAFLRPEVRYRNFIRAWRELDVEKTRYLSKASDPPSERLLIALARTEQIATDDEHQPDKQP